MTRRSAKADGAEKKTSFRETLRPNRDWDKTWLADEGTTIPNENKMSHHWRERAWQRDVKLKS